MKDSDFVDKVAELMNDESNTLTAWECQFIDSVHDTMATGQELTDGQEKKITELWEKVFA